MASSDHVKNQFPFPFDEASFELDLQEYIAAFRALNPQEQLLQVMKIMLEGMIHKTIFNAFEFELEKYNTPKKEKIILRLEDLAEFINIRDVTFASGDLMKQAFDNLVAQEDVVRADKEHKTFYLNMNKKGMVEQVESSVAYAEYQSRRPKPIDSHKADLSIRIEEQTGAFRQLIMYKSHDQVLSFLRSNGVNFQNSQGETALNLAVIDQNQPLVEKILKLKGVDVNLPFKVGGHIGNSPLISAALLGNVEILRLLVNAGANIKFKNGTLFDAFNAAAHRGNLAACQYLVREAKADPNVTAGDFPALISATIAGNLELVKFLLDECKAVVDRTNNAGFTALQLDELIAHGADINHQTKQGGTALMIALYASEPDIAYLLRCKCDLNIQDVMGETAVHIATKRGCYTALSKLLDAGARTDIRNREGCTAYDLSKMHKQSACRDLLATVAGKQATSVCSNCKKEGMNFQVCSRCKSARYCGTECQKLHWKVHKKECKDKDDLVKASKESLGQTAEKPDPSWSRGPPMIEKGSPSALWRAARTNMPMIPPEIERSQMYLSCKDTSTCINPEHVRFVKRQNKKKK